MNAPADATRSASSRHDEIVARLREAIISGALAPGARLSELQLARELGASRTPIREALQELEHQQLITIVPHVATFVRRITPNDVEEIYQIRIALESLAVSLVLSRLTSVGRAQIADVLQHMKDTASERDYEEYARARDRFHLLLVSLSGNARLKSLYESLNGPIRRLRRIDLQHSQRVRESLRANVRIAEAIIDLDPQASRYVTEHLSKASRVLVEAVRRLDASLRREASEEVVSISAASRRRSVRR
jgi:DNA-binding GntR family transcriptional regulator